MDAVDAALAEQEGPYFLDDFSLVDCVFAPFLERIGEMCSSSDMLPAQRGCHKTHLDLHSVGGLGSTLSMIFKRRFCPAAARRGWSWDLHRAGVIVLCHLPPAWMPSLLTSSRSWQHGIRRIVAGWTDLSRDGCFVLQRPQTFEVKAWRCISWGNTLASSSNLLRAGVACVCRDRCFAACSRVDSSLQGLSSEGPGAVARNRRLVQCDGDARNVPGHQIGHLHPRARPAAADWRCAKHTTRNRTS